MRVKQNQVWKCFQDFYGSPNFLVNGRNFPGFSPYWKEKFEEIWKKWRKKYVLHMPSKIKPQGYDEMPKSLVVGLGKGKSCEQYIWKKLVQRWEPRISFHFYFVVGDQWQAPQPPVIMDKCYSCGISFPDFLFIWAALAHIPCRLQYLKEISWLGSLLFCFFFLSHFVKLFWAIKLYARCVCFYAGMTTLIAAWS